MNAWSVEFVVRPDPDSGRFKNIQKYVDYLNRHYPIDRVEEWAHEDIYYPGRFLFLDKDTRR